MGVTTALAIVSSVSASVVKQSTESPQSPQSTKAPTSRAKTAFTGKLPALDGQQLIATLVEVTYPPGGANPAHRHPCPVIGYVLEGAVRMQVQGQDERIFKPGDTFFESPADVHAISANASQSEPARFLAYFVCDRATPLSVPVSEQRGEK
jgi:quercetin dioxygenase-like cupin family protein